MQVVKLTIAEKDLLIGQTWDGVTFFNPTLDADGEWFISQEEVNGCEKLDFQWLKSCDLIEYNPVVVNLPI
jgi:hypothetical protein